MPDLSLRFRHHLLRDHQHVGWFELSPRADELAEVVAGMDLRKALDRKKLDAIHTARRTRARSAGSPRSRATPGATWTPHRTPQPFAPARRPPRGRPRPADVRRHLQRESRAMRCAGQAPSVGADRGRDPGVAWRIRSL